VEGPLGKTLIWFKGAQDSHAVQRSESIIAAPPSTRKFPLKQTWYLALCRWGKVSFPKQIIVWKIVYYNLHIKRRIFSTFKSRCFYLVQEIVSGKMFRQLWKQYHTKLLFFQYSKLIIDSIDWVLKKNISCAWENGCIHKCSLNNDDSLWNGRILSLNSVSCLNWATTSHTLTTAETFFEVPAFIEALHYQHMLFLKKAEKKF